MTKRKLHVVYVCGDRGVPVGGYKGASAHIAELTRALVLQGAEVRILAARGREDKNGGRRQIPLLELGSYRSGRQLRQAFFDGARGTLAQARAAEAFSVSLNVPLARALERLHKEWRIDAIYERYSLWSHAAAGFAQTNSIPYLLEVNAPLRQEQRRYRILANDELAMSFESYLLRTASRVLVPAAELVPYVTRSGARSAAVSVIPNAADPERFVSRRRGGNRSSDGAFVVGFLGSLKPWHGIEYLSRAFRQLVRTSGKYRLLIAGEGPLRAELERTFRRAGLRGAVTFSGAVEHADVPALLEQMDVGLAPYPPGKGFYFSPIKIFEYMAAGVPIVASDIGQIGEILRHRETALLHRPGRVREMIACIETLRRHPQLAVGVSRRARALLRRRFTWRRNADRVLRMIEVEQRRIRARR